MNLDQQPQLRRPHRTPMTAGRILASTKFKTYLPRPEIRPGQYLAAFKGACAALGIPARVRELIDHLMAYVRPEDWAAGTPYVWPSNDELGIVLQLGRSQVKTIIRHARELGLIVIRESANGHRFGFRDDRGSIVEAYGFDLSPLAARFDEFHGVAQAFRAAKAARRRARIEATAVRNELIEIAAAGVDQAPALANWQRVHDTAYAHWQESRTMDDPDALAGLVEAMKQQRDDLLAALADSVNDGETDPKGAMGRPLNTSTNEPLASKDAAMNGIGLPADRSDTFSRASARRFAQEGERSRNSDVAQPDSTSPATDALRGFPASPALCLALAPALRGYLGTATGQPSWSDVIEAAYYVRSDLGLSKSLWAQACTTMGRTAATVMLAVVACRHRLGEVHASPGGLYRAMVNQHLDGKLRLDKTLHRLVDTTLKAKGEA